ncbi:ADP-ribosylation factor family-domain-containing protein [Lasiosphaeris hirsuta]|uniref:ADP-ribosylation factor family-domain-containing protein n=1 Tax=Lasiosphaeris hirsuta TaxID=260670 RepID=A0AA40AGI0_9PEZI|nr:ADP-ribosylation factor family-domain-containing protein [Lasiosphaeris hirsuta]
MPEPKKAKVVFLGLPKAGKTSLLQKLAVALSQEDKLATDMLTMDWTGEQELTMGNVVFRTFTISGRKQDRLLWKDYIYDGIAFVFVVDATDSDNFHVVESELHALLITDELLGKPFAVMGTKIDQPAGVTEAVLRERLYLSQAENRPVKLFMCSFTTNVGYGDGLKWLAERV